MQPDLLTSGINEILLADESYTEWIMAKFHAEYSMAGDQRGDMKTSHKMLFVVSAVIVLAVLIGVSAYFIQNKEGSPNHLLSNSSLSPPVQDYRNQYRAESHSCLEPFPSHQGEWFCTQPPQETSSSGQESAPAMSCSLECSPGYTHTKRSFTSCSGGEWTTPPGQMKCTQAFALITGGFSNQKSVEIYPIPEEMYFSSSRGNFPALPDWREDHTLDRADGTTLLCGGSLSYNHTVKSCLKLNLEDKKFHPHSTLTRDRKFHSSVVFGQQVVLIGGGDTKSSTLSSVTTEFLNPRMGKEWAPGHNLSELTEYACAVKVSRDSYVVIGGLIDFKYSNHVIQYNVTDGSSTRLPGLSSGKNDHGCVLVNNGTERGILVAGGHSTEADLPVVTTQMLNLETLKWEEMGRLHVGRYGLEMVVLGDRILAMGGKDKNHREIKSVEQFDIKTRKWSKVKDLRQARSNFALTTIPQCYMHRNGC